MQSTELRADACFRQQAHLSAKYDELRTNLAYRSPVILAEIRNRLVVALAAVKSDRTVGQLAEQFDVHPNQVTSWKAQLEGSAADVFGPLPSHGGFAEVTPALTLNVSRSTAEARSSGSIVNISIEDLFWDCVGASIIVATRR